MTLQEAYQSWQQQDDNRVLYAKTREAFQKTWFHLPIDKPCSYYTKDVLVQAMAAAATVFGGFKVRAASVMCHVLTYASQVEPKDNPKPDFTFSDLVRPAGDSGGQQRDAKKTKVRVIPCPSAAKEVPRALPCPSDAKEGNRRGRLPRPLAQLHPETLEVVKIWDTLSDVRRQLGASNIARNMDRVNKSAGFFWCNADEIDEYRKRISDKYRLTFKPSARHRSDDKRKASVSQCQPDTEKQKTHVDTCPSDTEKEPHVSLQQKLLSDYTDDELFDELDRRHWTVIFRRTEIVTIGTT